MTEPDEKEDVERQRSAGAAVPGELDPPDTDDSKKAVRKHTPPSSFALPTEAFVRKTVMRDRGPPGFLYNSTDYMSVGAAAKPGPSGSAVFLAPSPSRTSATLPGVQVRAYASSPTRDDRAREARKAAHTRADHEAKLTTKATLALKEGIWREALKAKTYALSASPREGKPDPDDVRVRRGRGTVRRRTRRTAAQVSAVRGLYHGVKVPADTFEAPFAGGNELDELPGRLESLVYPRRYIDWPKEEAPLPTLALDVRVSPIRHAVAFRSQQSRIVSYDAHRGTKDWDGPGAYEYEEPAIGRTNVKGNGELGADQADLEWNISGPGRGGTLSNCTGVRPRGMTVKEPGRLSPVFQKGASAFIHPSQPNTRAFPNAPASLKDAQKEVEATRSTAADEGGRDGRWGEGGARRGNNETGGPQTPPHKLWMFYAAGKVKQPALATEGWDGPGAYSLDGDGVGRVKEPGRLSPMFQEGSERQIHPRPESSAGDGTRRSPGTPDIIANWCLPYPEFKPPEPKTLAHDIRQSPIRFGACFLSVTDRFENVRDQASSVATDTGQVVGERGVSNQGRGVRAPVERYDLVAARRQAPSPNTWLGTSIRPGLPYNPSLRAEDASPTVSTATTRAQARRSKPSLAPTSPSQQHDQGDSEATSTSQRLAGKGSTAKSSPVSSTIPTTTLPGSGESTTPKPLSLAAVGKGLDQRAAARVADALNATVPAKMVSSAAAAAISAGLAKNWAGSRLGISDKDGGSPQKGCFPYSSGEKNATSVPCHAANNMLMAADAAQDAWNVGVWSHSDERPGIAEMLSAATKTKSSTTEEMNALDSGGEFNSEWSGEFDRRDDSPVPGSIASIDRMGTRPARPPPTQDDTRVGAHQLATGLPMHAGRKSRGVTLVGSGARKRRRSDSKADTKKTVAMMTKENLAAVEASIGAEATAADEQREKSLIRTVGRAKRGPCMLTLSSPLGPREDVEGQGVHQLSRVWETESSGGLVGPGQRKVLVC